MLMDGGHQLRIPPEQILRGLIPTVEYGNRFRAFGSRGNLFHSFTEDHFVIRQTVIPLILVRSFAANIYVQRVNVLFFQELLDGSWIAVARSVWRRGGL